MRPCRHNRGVKDVLIVEGAPPARERSARGNATGPAGLPEAIEATWPQATVPTCAGTTRFRVPGCGSSPTGESRKVAAALKADLHRPEPGGRLAGSDRLLRVRHGGQVPPDGDDLGVGLGAVHSLPGLPSDAQACHLSPTSWEVPPPPTYRDCELPAALRITDEPRPLPLSMRRRPELAKAGDLRHLWTSEPENATRRKDCQHPSAGPRADSSKGRSPPTRYKGPGPAPRPPTPTESTPTCKTLTQKTGR